MRTFFLICGPVIFLLLLLPVKPLHAQFNRLGGGLCFSTGIDEPPVETGNPGFNLRGIYELNDKLFIMPSCTFYVPKKASYPAFNLTTYYGHIDAFFGVKLAHEQQIMFYAIAGPDLTNLYKSYESNDPALQNKYELAPGATIGTGVEMIIDMNFNAYAQVNYIIGKYYQQLIISIGAHYYIKERRYKSWK